MKRINIQQITLAAVMLSLLTVTKLLDIVMVKTPLGYSWIEFYVPILIIFSLILPFPITLGISIGTPFLWFVIGQTTQISPLSFFLDYSLPVLIMSLVYLSRWIKPPILKKITIVLLIIIAFVFKWFFHTVSGVVAWDVPWAASAAVNAPYVFVTMAFSLVLVFMILPKLEELQKLVNKVSIRW